MAIEFLPRLAMAIWRPCGRLCRRLVALLLNAKKRATAVVPVIAASLDITTPKQYHIQPERQELEIKNRERTTAN